MRTAGAVHKGEQAVTAARGGLAKLVLTNHSEVRLHEDALHLMVVLRSLAHQPVALSLLLRAEKAVPSSPTY